MAYKTPSQESEVHEVEGDQWRHHSLALAWCEHGGRLGHKSFGCHQASRAQEGDGNGGRKDADQRSHQGRE